MVIYVETEDIGISSAIHVAGIRETLRLALGQCPIQALGNLVLGNVKEFGLYEIKFLTGEVLLRGVLGNYRLGCDQYPMFTIGLFVLQNKKLFGVDKIEFTTHRPGTASIEEKLLTAAG